MKKIFYIIALFALTILCTSCIDYVQTVCFVGGRYLCYYKVTVSKALGAVAGQDLSQAFDDIDNLNLPKNASIDKIDTELESGISLSLSINPSTKDGNEKQLLPKVTKKSIEIPFILGGEDFPKSLSSDDDTSEMTLAILSSAKCRILVSKNIFAQARRAYFSGGASKVSVPLYDYGDAWCAEVPFVLLCTEQSCDFTRLIIE